MPEPIFNKKLSFTASLSTTVLSLSLLAGCASSPEQDQPNETQESQTAVQTEVNDSPASEENTTTQETSPDAVESEAEASITNEQIEPTALNNTQTAESPVEGTVAVTTLVTNPSQSTAAPVARSLNKVGKSYGIWTLKEANDGRCKLSTSTLQISTSNNEYSSQIWMDIEEQRIVINAFMPMDITHPNTGIQIDSQTLIPFTEKLYSTRAVVTGDLTSELAQGNELHIFINGKEVGKQVLQRDVALTNMNSGINALQSCGK